MTATSHPCRVLGACAVLGLVLLACDWAPPPGHCKTSLSGKTLCTDGPRSCAPQGRWALRFLADDGGIPACLASGEGTLDLKPSPDGGSAVVAFSNAAKDPAPPALSAGAYSLDTTTCSLHVDEERSWQEGSEPHFVNANYDLTLWDGVAVGRGDVLRAWCNASFGGGTHTPTFFSIAGTRMTGN